MLSRRAPLQGVPRKWLDFSALANIAPIAERVQQAFEQAVCYNGVRHYLSSGIVDE